MADFDDITGWREELEAFEATEEGWTFFHKYASWDPKRLPPKVPYDTIIHLAGQYFRYPELHEALQKSAAWVAYLDANPDFGRDDDDFDELCPWEDNRTGIDFARWYAMKMNIPFDYETVGKGTVLAEKVANGALSSLPAPETRAFAEKEFSEDISFPSEEAQ